MTMLPLLLLNKYNTHVSLSFLTSKYRTRAHDTTYYAVSRHADRAGRTRSQTDVALCIALVPCRFHAVISFQGGHRLTVS